MEVVLATNPNLQEPKRSITLGIALVGGLLIIGSLLPLADWYYGLNGRSLPLMAHDYQQQQPR